MTDTVLILASPTDAVRRWIDRSGVAPYTSWNDRLEIPADTALAILKRLGDLTSPGSAEVYQAMSRAAVVQGFIRERNGSWYPVRNGETFGGNFSGRLQAMEWFFRYAVEDMKR